jgi:16S rRNA (uracil1498-N3)-methyltransferase
MAFDPNKIRLYVEDDLMDGSSVQLSRDQVHYLGTVMRQKASDQVYLFNGRDGEWRCDIVGLDRKKAAVQAVKQTRSHQATASLTLMFAPLNLSAIDLLVQKATELGCTDLQPVLTERTMTRCTDSQRMTSVAMEASERCERLDLPTIHEPQELMELLGAGYAGWTVIYCDEGENVPGMMTALEGRKGGPWAILIGPERGFSPIERANLRNQDNVIAVGLGPRILRADTAAVVALTLFQASLGDL